jgi:adenine-specific DNA methylase
LGETATPKLTHQLFRYPAKFHPPVVAKLLEQYTRPGDLVFDPFPGSGTALVEAMIRGRRSVGSDIDPVAAVVSPAKTRRYDLDEVDKTASAQQMWGDGEAEAKYDIRVNCYLYGKKLRAGSRWGV